MATRTERRTDGASEGAATGVRRIDRDGASTGPLLASHVRADGVTLYEGIAAREGILVYRRADGSTFRELVTLDALRSMAGGLPRGPITLEHPPEFVTPDNVARYGVGDVDGEMVIEEDKQGAFARVKIAVRRRDALDAVAAGKQELSPGYDVEVDPTPGVDPRFGAYDSRQLSRAVNHLAIVDRARGGPTVALRIDSADAESVAPSPPPGASMDPAALKALIAEIVNGVLAGIAEQKAKGEAAEAAAEAAAMDAAKAAAAAAPDPEKAAMEAKMDAMQKKLDAIEGAKLDAVAKRHAVKVDGLDLPAKRAAIASKIAGRKLDAADPAIVGLLLVAENVATGDKYAGEPAAARTDSQPVRPLSIHERNEKNRTGGAQ